MRPCHIYAGARKEFRIVRISIGSKLSAHNIIQYGGAGKTIEPVNKLLRAPAPVISSATTGQLLQRGAERLIATRLSPHLQVGCKHDCRARPVNPQIDATLTEALVRAREAEFRG